MFMPDIEKQIKKEQIDARRIITEANTEIRKIKLSETQ